MKGKKIILGILVFLGILFLGGSVSAQAGVNDTKTATIGVTISSKTMIDLVPASFSWTVDPGEACGGNISSYACNESNNFIAVQVENIGSHNISRIWFNNTYPLASPFGTGDPSNADAGNWVVLTSNHTTTDYYYVSKVEYNVTAPLFYITDPNGNMPPDNDAFTYGRFHNGSSEYFWFIDGTPNGATYCNDSTYIRVGNSPHTDSATGSVDFSDAGEYDQLALTPGAIWSTGNINTGSLDGYAVAVRNTTAGCQIWFSHWNKDVPFDTLSEAQYTFNKPNNPIVPGNSIAQQIGVIVPYGIHAGASISGTLVVVAMGAV